MDEIIEALNAANNNNNSSMTKNAKLFNSLVAECQVRISSSDSLIIFRDRSKIDQKVM